MYICRLDLSALQLEFVELLIRLVPNEEEMKKFQQFVVEKQNPKTLPEDDRFMLEVHRRMHGPHPLMLPLIPFSFLPIPLTVEPHRQAEVQAPDNVIHGEF